jgi:hypothetical protein
MRRTIKSLIAAQNRPSTPAEVAERIAYRAACEQATVERAALYPLLTADNFAEAASFQERRINELLGRAA